MPEPQLLDMAGSNTFPYCVRILRWRRWYQMWASQWRCFGVYLIILCRMLWSWMENTGMVWNRRHPNETMRGSRFFKIFGNHRCFLIRSWTKPIWSSPAWCHRYQTFIFFATDATAKEYARVCPSNLFRLVFYLWVRLSSNLQCPTLGYTYNY